MKLSPFTLILSIPYIQAQCPNKCSRNGICNNKGICECISSFTGPDCSQSICPKGKAFSDMPENQDVAHLEVTCSGRGVCVSGECECDEGFTGIACERTKCRNGCSNNGRCMSMRHLADDTRNQQSQQFAYSAPWDADKIFGCVCDAGFTGFDCSLRVCPTGDDPLTTTNTNQEIQLLHCSANSLDTGHIVLYYDGEHSPSITADASIYALKHAIESIVGVNEVSITYSEGSTLCRDDVTNIVSITFLQNFGPLPPLVPEKLGLDSSSVVEVAADSTYGMLTDHNGVNYFSVKGDKENDECSNRGLCDQDTGTCSCFDTNGDVYAGSDGYGGVGDRGDCGHAVTSVITTCPGDPPCSNNGVCDPMSKRCACAEGYSGGDCSQRTCKRGLSWFSYPSASNVAHDKMAECSDMGICHRVIGQCYCNAGFFGGACEYMGCESSSKSTCNGHGSCVSIRELGLLHEDSDGTSLPVAYGSDPNSSLTWDADRIMGCHCDEGYDGFNCELRVCPSGKDVLLEGDDTLFTCSNHGICNHELGNCECFRGWGSSDGNGGLGSHRDCGHRLALRGYP